MGVQCSAVTTTAVCLRTHLFIAKPLGTLEHTLPVKVFPVDERQHREVRARLLPHEIDYSGVLRLAIQNAPQPDVHRPVRVVLSVPDPAVEIRVTSEEFVVYLARGPGEGRFCFDAAHVSEPAREVPGGVGNRTAKGYFYWR